MGKYDELKKLAEAAAGNWEDSLLHEYSECEFYIENASPAVVLSLIAENEALNAESEQCREIAEQNFEAFNRMMAERDQFKAENERLHADNRAVWETITNTIEKLGIDTEAAKSAAGKPSDVLVAHVDQLRAELERARASLREVSAIVDGNIREIVCDLVNRDAGLNNGANPNDIYAECDRIDTEIDAAMGKGGRADG